MSDLVERLRNGQRQCDRDEAADEIERLTERELELESSLTQDPKDARCQLWKQTAQFQSVADEVNSRMGRLTAEIERLKGLLQDAIDNQRPDARGWFRWWTGWTIKATKALEAKP